MDIIMRIIANLIGGSMRKSANKKRQGEASAVAEELGLEFLPHVDMLQELSGSDLSDSAGPNKQCINCLGGQENELQYKVFQFDFTTGHGKNMEIHRQTVACIELGHSFMADFQVKTKGFFDKLFGAPTNTFEMDDLAFSKTYWTCSTEPTRARNLLSAEVMAWIHAHDWSVESNKGRLLIYKPRWIVDASRMKSFIDDSMRLVTMLEEAASRSSGAGNPQPATAGV